MLQILFLSLIFSILALFLILSLPYHYLLTFDYQQTIKLEFYFSVLFFKINFIIRDNRKEFYLRIFNFKLKLPLKNYGFKIRAHSKKAAAKIKNNKSVPGFFSLINLFQLKNISHLLKFVKKIVKQLQPKSFKLNLLLSFSDPYYNGLLLAYYYPLKELFGWSEISLEINWQKPCFNADGEVGGRIFPIKIFFILLNFIFSRQSFKIFWLLYKSN